MTHTVTLLFKIKLVMFPAFLILNLGLLMMHSQSQSQSASSQNTITMEEVVNCQMKCNKNNPNYTNENMKKGLWVCATPTDWPASPWDDCELDCLRLEKDSDQNKCFFSYCKMSNSHTTFCEGPGKSPIKKHECNELVYSGKVKYYGNYCAHDN